MRRVLCRFAHLDGIFIRLPLEFLRVSYLLSAHTNLEKNVEVPGGVEDAQIQFAVSKAGVMELAVASQASFCSGRWDGSRAVSPAERADARFAQLLAARCARRGPRRSLRSSISRSFDSGKISSSYLGCILIYSNTSRFEMQT